MDSIEIKAEIFDILKKLEALQVQANALVQKKNELLKQLEQVCMTDQNAGK